MPTSPASPAPTMPGAARRAPSLTYTDVPGFCRSATLDEIREHAHVLTPGRYGRRRRR
jgi:type I restriction-modification system DNA methylase subunit